MKLLVHGILLNLSPTVFKSLIHPQPGISTYRSYLIFMFAPDIVSFCDMVTHYLHSIYTMPRSYGVSKLCVIPW